MSFVPRGVEGVIHPPPQIAHTVEKTAEFIASRGPQGETQVRSGDSSARFAFLDGGHEYHTYYLSRLEEHKAKLNDPNAQPTSAPEEPSAASAAAPAPTPAAPTAKPKQVKQRSNPLPKEHTVDLTDVNISACELDVIRHTAYYVARHGKAIISQIAQDRDRHGSRFDFLKGSSPRFALYQRFLNSYAKVLQPPRGLVEALQDDADNLHSALTLATETIEWRKADDEARRNKESEAERQRNLFHMIDWQDFVVVETIDFGEGAGAAATPGAPPPLPPRSAPESGSSPSPPPLPTSLPPVSMPVPVPAAAAAAAPGQPPMPPSFKPPPPAQKPPPPPGLPGAPAPTVKKATTVVTVMDEDEDVSAQVRDDYVRGMWCFVAWTFGCV